MKPNEKYNPTALFIHIAKTGGSSIGKAPFVILQGSPAWSPKIAVNDLGLRMSFTFVRNPYSRFTSACLGHDYATPDSLEEWVLGEFREKCVEKFKNWEWQELIPQNRYLIHDGKEDVDFVGRFENIREDWKKLCERLGEEFELPHLNKNKISNHESYMNEMIKAVVRDVYLEDFELLGYEK